MKKTTSITPKNTRTWHKSIDAFVMKISHDEQVLSKTYAQAATTNFKFDADSFHSKRSARPSLANRPKWVSREYREAYMEAAIEQGVAWQIRLNRELRGMSQRELAKALGTHQSAVSRLEDPSYGAQSLDTLLKIAKVFDCVLSVKFVSYSQLAYESERLGEAEQCAVPFEVEWSELNGNPEEAERSKAVLHGRRTDHLC